MIVHDGTILKVLVLFLLCVWDARLCMIHLHGNIIPQVESTPNFLKFQYTHDVLATYPNSIQFSLSLFNLRETPPEPTDLPAS
jgi:hypothetical protein